MSASLVIPESRYANRRKKLMGAIQGDVAIISAATEKVRSLDQFHPYAPDRNFYYLTGLEEPQATLVLVAKKSNAKSILFLRDKNEKHEKFEGPRLGVRKARSRFQIDEVYDIEKLPEHLPQLVKDSGAIHVNPGINPALDRYLWEHFSNPSAPRSSFPSKISDIREKLSEMRAIKDADEIRLLTAAASCTAKAMKELVPKLKDLNSEKLAAKELERLFIKHGGSGLAFDTIIASGKNATTLHHKPTGKRIAKSEMVLIDCGASIGYYAGDITRCFAPSGKFSTAQAEVYDAVLKALDEGIKLAKPGCTLDKIHKKTIRSLSQSLIEMGVIKGGLKKALADHRYRPFYMHRTSHLLGLDVHDLTPKEDMKYALQPGSALTIEPGLYFDATDKRVPKELRGIGVRLEQDVVIIRQGNKVISKEMPIRRSELPTA